jgi:hypothetical protein
MSRVFLVVWLMLFLFEAATAQPKVDSLVSRVKNLEDYERNIEKLYQINAEKLNKHVDEKVDESLKEIEESKKILALLLYLGIPATVISLLIAYFGAISKSKKIMVEKIEKIIEHKKEEIIAIIETQEFDTKLKKEKKLIVISQTSESQEMIKNLISRFQFRNVTYTILANYQPLEEFDLLIFDNLEQAEIDQYVADNTDACFVAYTKKRLENRNDRLNFSNSAFTLYHNILSSLKYSTIIKPDLG